MKRHQKASSEIEETLDQRLHVISCEALEQLGSTHEQELSREYYILILKNLCVSSPV